MVSVLAPRTIPLSVVQRLLARAVAPSAKFPLVLFQLYTFQPMSMSMAIS